MATSNFCGGEHTKAIVEKCTFLWVLEEFSYLDEVTTRTFSATGGKVSWSLCLYPKPKNGKKTYIQIMRRCSDYGKSYQFTYTFRLTDSMGSLITSKSGNGCVSAYTNKKHDDIDLIEREVLLERLADNVLKIHADFAVPLSVAKKPFPQSPPVNIPNVSAALFETKKFTDFVIRIQETDIPVHKGVLAIKSPVFEAMLLHDTTETQLGVLELKDMELESVKAMIEFFYMNTVSKLNVALALELLTAADKYNVVDLVKYSSSYLQGNIDTSNVVDIMVAASKLSTTELKEECVKYITKNRPFKLDDKFKENMEVKDGLLEFFLGIQ